MKRLAVVKTFHQVSLLNKTPPGCACSLHIYLYSPAVEAGTWLTQSFLLWHFPVNWPFFEKYPSVGLLYYYITVPSRGPKWDQGSAQQVQHVVVFWEMKCITSVDERQAGQLSLFYKFQNCPYFINVEYSKIHTVRQGIQTCQVCLFGQDYTAFKDSLLPYIDSTRNLLDFWLSGSHQELPDKKAVVWISTSQTHPVTSFGQAERYGNKRQSWVVNMVC